MAFWVTERGVCVDSSLAGEFGLVRRVLKCPADATEVNCENYLVGVDDASLPET